MDDAVNLGKQGIVFTHPNVLSCMKFCSHLAHQDISGPNILAAKTLDTASLSRTITAVP